MSARAIWAAAIMGLAPALLLTSSARADDVNVNIGTSAPGTEAAPPSPVVVQPGSVIIQSPANPAPQGSTVVVPSGSPAVVVPSTAQTVRGRDRVCGFDQGAHGDG